MYDISRSEKEYRQGQFVNVEGHLFEKVAYIKYLGHRLTQDDDLKMEIITKGCNKCYFGLGKINRLKIDSKTVENTDVYNTFGHLVVLYTSPRHDCFKKWRSSD